MSNNFIIQRCVRCGHNTFIAIINCKCASLFVWLVFLTSSSTTRLYLGRAPRQSVLPHMRQSWETMTSVSAGHIILTPTQPVGSGRPQRESNPGLPHQESRALPTELLRPPKCATDQLTISLY